MNTLTTPAGARRGPKANPETRANLIRAGVAMLHAEGYAATGVKDIVEAAHVPKGSFYNHFESKEDFGREVVDAYFADGQEALEKVLCASDVPGVERLRGYFEMLTQGFIDQGFAKGCLMGNLSLEIADHSSKIRDRLAFHFDAWSQLVENCIIDGQSTGHVSKGLSARTLADFLLNSWEGSLVRMRTEKNAQPLRDFMSVVFESVLR